MKLLKIDPADLFSSEEEQILRAYDTQANKVAFILEEGQQNT
jgi:hypothetical protein